VTLHEWCRQLKVGDIVRSNYRAPWIGIVIQVLPRREKHHKTLIDTPIVYTVIVRDRHGACPRRRIVKGYDAHWLQPGPRNIDLSNIPGAWLQANLPKRI